METEEVYEFAEILACAQARIADRSPSPGTVDTSVPGLRLTIVPSHDTPYPSSNQNRAQTLPGGVGWQKDSAAKCVDRYVDAGVERFFLWVNACPEFERIVRDLKSSGFSSFTGASYPVLARSADRVPQPDTSFAVRPFNPSQDRKRIGDYPDSERREAIVRSLKHADEQFFVAWEGKTPVATASVVVNGLLGYLYGTFTLEPYRGRGAQTALIAARVNYAVELGCKWVASETVSRAKTSLGNLKRQGFRVIYKKRVFSWKEKLK